LPDNETGEVLLAGVDDKIFRVDRAEFDECVERVERV